MPQSSSTPVITDGLAMRAWAQREREQGRRIALVPTMGALHEGHLRLVEVARAHADAVVVSIFVNPTQFGPKEDFSRYPRDLDGDLRKLASVGVDAVFAPGAEAIYPPGFDTYVAPERMAQGLCGASRPGHFRGVATVVLLLFRMTRCHVALFGEKDYQQLQIIRRMAKDLWLDVEIIGVPIVREPDGLARSSRNAYLSASERSDALGLSRALARVAGVFAAGERRSEALVAIARAVLAEIPTARIDYVAVVDAENLEPIDTIRAEAVCALAVHIGTTRLIDNRRLVPA